MKSKLIIAWLALIGLIVAATSCQAANQSPASDLMFCADQAVFAVSIAQDGKTEMRKVVDLPADATCPVWSPDGKFALLYRYRQVEFFVQEDGLSLINRQSGTIHEVYRFGPGDDGWRVRWVQDGAELILASARDQLQRNDTKCDATRRSLNHLYGLECWKSYLDFYLGKISSQNGLESLDRLTNLPTWRCVLQWSPDGSKLAFTHGTLCSEGGGEEGNVSVLDLNTRGISVVVDAAAYISQHPGAVNRSLPDGWSPNGEKLAISSLQDNYIARNSIADANGVHLVPPEGASGTMWLPDSKRLLWFEQGFGVTNTEDGVTETLPILLDPQHDIGDSVISPDGRYLAWRETDTQDKTGQIRIFDFTNGATSTILGLKPETLKWSPDSQWLAFPVKTQLKANSCDYQIDIYVVKPDVSGLRNLTSGQAMMALRCKPSTGMGSGWYNAEVQDVQWVSR